MRALCEFTVANALTAMPHIMVSRLVDISSVRKVTERSLLA